MGLITVVVTASCSILVSGTALIITSASFGFFAVGPRMASTVSPATSTLIWQDVSMKDFCLRPRFVCQGYSACCLKHELSVRLGKCCLPVSQRAGVCLGGYPVSGSFVTEGRKQHSQVVVRALQFLASLALDIKN